MEQVPNFGDRRMQTFCVHCGGREESRDHVPSKVFLDPPYPANLHVTPSCFECNNGFSSDEKYLACAIECVLAGEVDPSKIERARIAIALLEDNALMNTLRQARREEAGTIMWDLQRTRVENIILKLARQHAAYEFNEPQLEDPSYLTFKPLISMTQGERDSYENPELTLFAPFPEVGSRAMLRILEGPDVSDDGWIVVQPGSYRFRVLMDGGIRVQFILREYLACDVLWE